MKKESHIRPFCRYGAIFRSLGPQDKWLYKIFNILFCSPIKEWRKVSGFVGYMYLAAG
jgi:hypothetical protein